MSIWSMPCRQITPVFLSRLFQRRACRLLRQCFSLRHSQSFLPVNLVFRNSLRKILVLFVQFKHHSCLFSFYGSSVFIHSEFYSFSRGLRFLSFTLIIVVRSAQCFEPTEYFTAMFFC